MLDATPKLAEGKKFFHELCTRGGKISSEHQ